jgi:hypothetical protein
MRKASFILLIGILLTSCFAVKTEVIETKIESQEINVEEISYADQNTLSYIAKNDGNSEIRKLALKRLQ